MKKTITQFISFVALGLMLQACAHTAEKRVDAELAQQTPVKSETALQKQSEDAIDSSHLPEAKKNELKALRTDAREKMASLHQESLQLRSLLIKSMLAQKFDRNAVEAVKNRIKKNEKARVALMFNTVDRANVIIGRETDMEARERMMDEMYLPSDLDHPEARSMQ